MPKPTDETLKKKSISQAKTMDDESNAMLFEGASLSQLTHLFGQDIRKIKSKLHGLMPTKTRGGHPIYNIKEAARYLVEPAWPIDEYIKRMNHADLPTLLKKEYWAGMRSRQIYEIAAGDLWPTDKVIEHVSEILKTVSISLRLAEDAVEREARLTPTQRNLVRHLMDEALSNAHQVLHKLLTERNSTGVVSDGGNSANQLIDDESEL